MLTHLDSTVQVAFSSGAPSSHNLDKRLRRVSRGHVFVDSSRLLLIAIPGFIVSFSRTATCSDLKLLSVPSMFVLGVVRNSLHLLVFW